MPLANALALLGTGDKYSYCHVHTLLHCCVAQVIVIITCELTYACICIKNLEMMKIITIKRNELSL